jgi:8-oxo-dGTP pyrophosphatase MutT (NUDIX family)
LVLRSDHVRLPNGAEIPEYWISEYPPWVNVVAVTTDDKLVLVRQYRPALGQVHFELPAGVVDPSDASLQAAAARELAEETGYGGGTWSLLTTLSANPALQTNLSYAFLAVGVTLQTHARPEDTEDLRVHLVPVAEAEGLLNAEDMIQALHFAPLARYLLTRAHK